MLYSIPVVVALLVVVLQIFQQHHDVGVVVKRVDAFVIVNQRTTLLTLPTIATTFQTKQQQQQPSSDHYRRHSSSSSSFSRSKALTMISPIIESSSSITTSLIGESLAIGNIVTASLLFGAGVAATLKRSVESSTDDKALKDLLKKDDNVVKVGIQSNEDSSVKVVQIEEEQKEVVVEPVQVKNQSTETPLETKVVEDLMVEVKKEETASSVTEQDWKQLKKDVTEEIQTVREELASPTIVKELEKDITQLKTEIGNTFEESKTTKSAGIKRSVVSKEDIKDIKDQVQESLNVASSGGKKQKKRRFVVKLVKKIIMPWKSWKNL